MLPVASDHKAVVLDVAISANAKRRGFRVFQKFGTCLNSPVISILGCLILTPRPRSSILQMCFLRYVPKRTPALVNEFGTGLVPLDGFAESVGAVARRHGSYARFSFPRPSGGSSELEA